MAPGVNLAMAAWAAYDLARLGMSLAGSAIKGTVNTVAGGVKSWQGGINTGPMRQGYVDTEMAMTSRQRGVTAIANSRLNARSVLGIEASMMSAHFG